jgi:Fe-S-cluster-containing hydrogenase component 2
VDGVAVIDEDKSTGCGVCVSTCPRGIINLLPRHQTVLVLCRNRAIGALLGCSAKPRALAANAVKNSARPTRFT